jgi:spermidine synthase
LVDEYAAGHPAVAGKAYAVNVLGCILGPIFASYVLLPWIREMQVLILLGVPFSAFLFVCSKSLPRWQRWTTGFVAGAALVGALFFANDFEGVVSRLKNGRVRRDYAASVAAFGKNLDKKLYVNGVGMTALTPATKFMVHLPLAFHQGQPESALIICFGMGTTYRSALSWGIETTTVELVPSVTKMFGFYHADAVRVLNNPKGHIIIDDGRRYLKRTHEKFDVIVIDPPPPVEAAGSSLLYSTEFYDLAKQHLKPHGILQAWVPGREGNTFFAVLRSVHDAFPYVRCFDSMEGWGVHMLASMEPIEKQTAEQLAGRMPAEAKKDLLEWSPSENLPAYIQKVLSQEKPIEEFLSPNLKIRITDDQPYNEYYLLRRLGLMAY